LNFLLGSGDRPVVDFDDFLMVGVNAVGIDVVSKDLQSFSEED